MRTDMPGLFDTHVHKMAASINKLASINALDEMFSTLASNMSERDTEQMRNAIMYDRSKYGGCFRASSIINWPRKLVRCDAQTFFRFLASKGVVDETVKRRLQDGIRFSNPELLELISLPSKKKGEVSLSAKTILKF